MSQLNLLGTQLVVFSTCDAELGDVANGEGRLSLLNSIKEMEGLPAQPLGFRVLDGVRPKNVTPVNRSDGDPRFIMGRWGIGLRLREEAVDPVGPVTNLVTTAGATSPLARVNP